MIGSTRQVAVWVYESPVDMRRSFDGLYALVKQGLGRNPLSGDCFLFVSRNRKRAKVLFWDGTGLCVYAKYLASHYTSSCLDERVRFGHLLLPSSHATGQRVPPAHRRRRRICPGVLVEERMPVVGVADHQPMLGPPEERAGCNPQALGHLGGGEHPAGTEAIEPRAEVVAVHDILD